MNGPEHMIAEPVKEHRFFPYAQYWVLIILAFCLMLVAAIAFFAVAVLSQKLLFFFSTMLLGFIIHWLLMWTSVCVTFCANGIKRDSYLTKQSVFTSWNDIHFVYLIVDRKAHLYVLLSSHSLDSSGIKSTWGEALVMKSFFQMEDICFRISRIEYEQLIEHICSSPASSTIVICNDILHIP